MTTVQAILDWFEVFAPVASAMDFDNVGLLVGAADAAVGKVLLALDITPAVAEEAAARGCELIISHHPVIFQSLKRLHPASAPYLLARYGIAAVCMHTNLDLSERFGVNTCLAAALGVKSLRKSAAGECLFIGELAEPTPLSAFTEHIKRALDCEGLRCTGVQPMVQTVAVSSGAGGSEIFAAAREGADVLVTGEIKHHEINAANDLGVGVIDVGHFKSENIVIAPLCRKLQEAFPEVDFTVSEAYSDQIRFM